MDRSRLPRPEDAAATTWIVRCIEGPRPAGEFLPEVWLAVALNVLEATKLECDLFPDGDGERYRNVEVGLALAEQGDVRFVPGNWINTYRHIVKSQKYHLRKATNSYKISTKK